MHHAGAGSAQKATYSHRLSPICVFAEDPEWNVAGVPPVVPHADWCTALTFLLELSHCDHGPCIRGRDTLKGSLGMMTEGQTTKPNSLH
jgi:hypothetical protein